ncbi:MAG TPA: histidine phosphatase family protein [Rhizomicrobium sp.]|nr:histidine phosphatase family protein [Rhizomicrobium sp.]
MQLELPPGLTLYFARHGQTVANLEQRFSGWKDTPLTALGREQAAMVGRALGRAVGTAPGLGFVASPLQRARTTMEIALGELGLAGHAYATDPRLAEINLGLWDQLTDAEARALDPALFDARAADKWTVHVPGGENYAEVAARVSGFVAGLTADTFAVSHGATTRILRGLLAGLGWEAMSALDEPQGCVFRARGREVVRLDAG